MASFNGFETMPGVECSIVVDDEGQSVPELVEEFIEERKQRDQCSKQWLECLTKIWELARQGETVKGTLLARKAMCLLSEAQIKSQQCKKMFESLLTQPNMIKLCILAPCFWCPKNEVQLCCGVFSSENKIKCGGSEMKSFTDATVGYIEKNFPHLNQAHRVPSVCTNYKKAPAVETLVKRLVSCEQKLPGGMFVISNLKHQNYLGNINGKQQLVTAQDGDHDIIVIHRRLGVIFFQVKGCSSESDKKTKHQAVCKALRQVMMDKFVFMESNRDLEFVHMSLPVYGFAALPHLQSGDLDKLNICSKHCKNTLTLSDLENLSEWLKERVFPHGNVETNVLDEDQYKIICGRYVGLVSMVSLRTYSEGIRSVGETVENIFLTQAQVALIKKTNHKFLFLTGDYGTGKSLVLAKKAQRLVEEDEGCVAFIISCSDIDNYQLCKFEKPYRSADQLRCFVKDERNSRIRILQFSDILQKQVPNDYGKRMVSSEEFYDTIISYISDFVRDNPDIKTHVFLDEVVNALFLAGSPNDIKKCKLWDNIQSVLPEGSFLWISISTHSYTMQKDFDLNPLVSHMPNGFIWHYLEYVMRVTLSVCDLVKGIEEHIGQGFFHQSSIGHTFMGPMPLLSTLTDCECPSPTTPLCHKVMTRFNFKSHDVTIIMILFHCNKHVLPLYSQFQRAMQSAFCELGISLQWNTMYGVQIPKDNPIGNQRVISVVDQHTFIGCECQNVMCIDIFGMFQWFNNQHATEWFPLIVNRCRSQYVHISWPEKEARKHWLHFLNGFEQYCKTLNDATFTQYIPDMIEDARNSDGDCVRFLKERELIHEIR